MQSRPYISFNAYFSALRDMRVAVVGLGISNRPLTELLVKAGAHVTVHDSKPFDKLGPLASRLQPMGVEFCLGDNYLDSIHADFIFRSPGIRPDVPSFLASGAYLTSEMEAFFEVCPCRIIAVTGSDGKTTTTTLISEILKSAGHTVHLGGNLGTPLLSTVPRIRPEDICVLELSSFQLMTMHRSPDIAVITNISPNHLDIHRDMDEYVAAKKNIFLHQHGDGRVVLNMDNAVTASFKKELPSTTDFVGVSFGAAPECSACKSNCVYLRDGTIYARKSGCDEPVIDASDILIPGRHNIENFMCAIAATAGTVSREHVYRVAQGFKGVQHRLELVRELDGVKYFNSSIDSSPTRTAAALSVFSDKVVAIMGGKDKGVPFDGLLEPVREHCAAVVLVGATADAIQAAISPSGATLERAQDMDDAVRKACALAASLKAAAVVLSPASTSFDMFCNFEERGAAFCSAVSQLKSLK